MPKKKQPVKQRPLYRRKPPKSVSSDECQVTRKANTAGRASPRAETPQSEFHNPHFLAPAHFTLHEDGSIATFGVPPSGGPNRLKPELQTTPPAPQLIFRSESPFIRLYQGNCLEFLDAIYARHGNAGRFDAIFADPPYFLSNGGITCHAGRMVKVDKGGWDVSRGPELNHEFNLEWLRRCQRVLKPNGTLWVSGTHHVIFSIGYALQQLGWKILNDIAWEKPNPPPNLSCRYFTHSTETLLWAAKNDKSRHLFNYQEMRKVTGKQMKTVWRKNEFTLSPRDLAGREPERGDLNCTTSPQPSPPSATAERETGLDPIWTLGAPGSAEKTFGKHPTQKPVALIERCLLASTNENDLVLDPFLGNGTTAVAAIRLKRQCVGIELDLHNVQMAEKRVKAEIISIWLRHVRVRIEISVFCQNDLDLFSDSINGSHRMADVPQIETERIFHECKFVFLSCAQVERGAVVHTTVDVSLQEAWAKTPNGKKRETTHIVRCETEIFRVKSS